MNPETRRRQRIWWPEPAESINIVLQKMFIEHFEDYRKKHFLLKDKKDIRLMRRWCKRQVNQHDIRHYQARNRTQKLNQPIGATARAYRDYPNMVNQYLLRNGHAGIGSRNKALRRRPLAKAVDWTSRVHDTNIIPFFNWNAGNLSRVAQGDTLNDLLISPYHLEAVQEASTHASQPSLMESRGIASQSSRDGSIMINSGGSGYKMVRKTHSDVPVPTNSRPAPINTFCDWIQRPSMYFMDPPKFDGDAIDEEYLSSRPLDVSIPFPSAIPFKSLHSFPSA